MLFIILLEYLKKVLLTPEKGGLKAPNSSKKEKIKLPVISPEVGKSQKNLKYKPISTIKRKIIMKKKAQSKNLKNIFFL